MHEKKKNKKYLQMEVLSLYYNLEYLLPALMSELIVELFAFHLHVHSMMDSIQIVVFAAKLNMVVEHVDNMDICHNPLELIAQVMFHQLSLVECRLKHKNYWPNCIDV